MILKNIGLDDWSSFFSSMKPQTVENQLLTAKEKKMHVFVISYWNSKLMMKNQYTVVL